MDVLASAQKPTWWREERSKTVLSPDPRTEFTLLHLVTVQVTTYVSVSVYVTVISWTPGNSSLHSYSPLASKSCPDGRVPAIPLSWLPRRGQRETTGQRWNPCSWRSHTQPCRSLLPGAAHLLAADGAKIAYILTRLSGIFVFIPKCLKAVVVRHSHMG